MVSGMRGIDLALRWDKGLLPFVQNSRILKAVDAVDSLETRQNLAPSPSMMFDPNQSNKRRAELVRQFVSKGCHGLRLYN
ncbi:hypothetical protein DITRI_Ditri04bG0050200 [Diplodiscus trichospermus]